MGVGIYYIGVLGVWVFFEWIGFEVGIFGEEIGVGFVLVLVCGFFGLLIVVVVSMYFWVMGVIVISIFLVVLFVVLMWMDFILVMFGIMLILFNVVWNFILFYIYEMIGKLDFLGCGLVFVLVVMILGFVLGFFLVGYLFLISGIEVY